MMLLSKGTVSRTRLHLHRQIICSISSYFHQALPSVSCTSTSFSNRLLQMTLQKSKGCFDNHPCRYTERFFSNATNNDQVERDEMPFDVLIVGGGPAGLSAAIRLKQLCATKGIDLSVCIVEKGSEIGAHILSGNVFDPKVLVEDLFPGIDWVSEMKAAQTSMATPVSDDQFLILPDSTKSYRIPNSLLPKELHNEGNFIISLSQLCRWLASKAEEFGVEIYPGFAASEVLYNEDKTIVKGVATRDVGIGKDGKAKDTFQRGVALLARQTLFAEGARGSCSESLIQHFNLRQGKASQTYGLGIKEVWEIPKEQHKAGLVLHTLGFPLQSSFFDKTYGGAFLYHQEPNLVLAGLVIGLDYANPYINPYKEFQKWKTHADIRKHFEGGTCISYGARVLNEGGFHSIPKLTFPGGALIGCSAGFLNAVKIKGTHNAMKSGTIAAESVFRALTNSDYDSVADCGSLHKEEINQEVDEYEEKMKHSWVHDELYRVRNCHDAFRRWGVGAGLVYSGFATHVSKGREPWTFHHSGTDADATQKSHLCSPISYPSPDGVLTFDLLTNLQRSGTYHDDDQEAHLRIKPELKHIPESVSLREFAGPEQRFCPAGVYEYVDVGENPSSAETKKLVINAQNCIHCKCCSIKTPKEYISWTVPEGGGGPNYQIM